MTLSVTGAVLRQSSNPLRSEVLKWYHTIVKSAFSVPWKSDDDAMYVLTEARRLFRQNQFLTDIAVIQRKIQEAEMRYGVAVHYLIPYPKVSHKAQGTTQESGVALRPELDSMYDATYNPRIGDARLGEITTAAIASGGDSSEPSSFIYNDDFELLDTNNGLTYRDMPERTR